MTRPSPRLVLAALIAVQVLFGINYVVSKVVVTHFPPLVWGSIRIIISTLVMLAVAKLSKRPHPKADFAFFGPLVIYAALGTVINQASFLMGLKYTTSTNSAILNTLIPVFTLLIVTVRGQEKLTTRRFVGFLLAFAGVLAVRKVEEFTISDQTAIGDALTILNCLSYGLFLSFSKKFLEKYDPLWSTAWLFVYGSIGITLLALPDWLHFVPPVMDASLWNAAIFAVLGATLVTYFLNFWALRHAKSSQVAIFIYVQPVITALIMWSYYGEEPTLRTVLASALIFVGMLFALQKKA